jgi:hypothetical protein
MMNTRLKYPEINNKMEAIGISKKVPEWPKSDYLG